MVGSGPHGGGTSCGGGQGPAPRTPQAAVSAATWVHGTRPPQRGARSPPLAEEVRSHLGLDDSELCGEETEN